MTESFPVEKSEAERCNRCGVFGANEIAGEWLCQDCYVNAGACCAGCEDED